MLLKNLLQSNEVIASIERKNEKQILLASPLREVSKAGAHQLGTNRERINCIRSNTSTSKSSNQSLI